MRKNKSIWRKLICCMTLILFLLTTITQPVFAYYGPRIKIKSDVDNYNLVSGAFPEIPLSALYNQLYYSVVDIETASLEVLHRDFVVAGIDGLHIPLVRRYESASNRIGIFGPGWSCPLETRIVLFSPGRLELMDERGKISSFYEKTPGVFQSYEKIRETIRREPGTYVRFTPDGLEYEYNHAGLLIAIKSRNGNRIHLQYDKGKPVNIVDSVGKIIKMKYSSFNRLSAIVLPSGHKLTYAYNPDGYLIKTIGLFGEEVKYSYKDKVLTRITYPENRWSAFSYDPGTTRVIKHTAPEGYVANYNFNKQGDTIRFSIHEIGDRTSVYETNKKTGKLVMIDALGRKTVVTRHPKFKSLPLEIISPSGRTIEYRYDNLGKLIEIKNPLGNFLTYRYNNKGQVSDLTSPRGGQWRFIYDERGNLTSITDPNGKTGTLRYNSNGTVASTTDGSGNTYDYFYDEYGNLIRLVDPYKRAYLIDYDDLNRVLKASVDEQNLYRIEYADEARRMRIQQGQEWVDLFYDQSGLLKKIQDSAGRASLYQHNGHGLLSTVVDPDNNSTEYFYDAVANLTQVMLPGGDSHHYVYDKTNNLIKTVDPLNNALRYEYDLDNAVVSSEVQGMPPVNYSYDNGGRLISVAIGNYIESEFQYDADNNLIQAQRNGNITTIERDLSGLITTLSIPDRDQVFEIDREPRSLTRDIVYPSGRIVSYVYDKLGRTAGVNLGETNKTILFEREPGAEYINYPNGVVAAYYYDDDGQLVSLEVRGPEGDQLLKHEYNYDEKGNLIVFNSLLDNDRSNTYRYQYDTLDQLTEITGSDGEHFFYEYDRDGNRRLEKKNGMELNYTYKEGRLVHAGDKRYEYDAAGNLIGRTTSNGTDRFTVSPSNELLSYQGSEGTVSYEYDGFGQRTTQTVNGEKATYDYLFGHIYAESLHDNRQREYIYTPGTDEIVAMVENEDSYYYYHRDLWNNVVMMTDPSGNVVNQYSYLPFGEVDVEKEQIENVFTFTGRPVNTVTGLYDLRTRFYQPGTGRFISEDGFPAFAAVPQSLNRYAYVFNNPNRYRDPNGEFLHVLVGGAIGAAINVGITIAANAYRGKETTWENIAGAAVSGAITGGVAAATCGASLPAQIAAAGISQVAATTAGNVTTNVLNGEPTFKNVTVEGCLVDGAIAACTAGVLGSVTKNVPTWMGTRTGSITKHLGNLGRGSLRDQARSFIRHGSRSLNQVGSEAFGSFVGNAGTATWYDKTKTPSYRDNGAYRSFTIDRSQLNPTDAGGQGNSTTITRPDGSTTTRTDYPDGSHEITVKEPDGTTHTTHHSADGSKTSHTTRLDGTWMTSWLTPGNTIQSWREQQPDGSVETFNKTDDGWQIHVENRDKSSSIVDYVINGDITTREIDADGNLISSTVDHPGGIRTIQDYADNGNITTTKIDSEGNLISSTVTYPDESITVSDEIGGIITQHLDGDPNAGANDTGLATRGTVDTPSGTLLPTTTTSDELSGDHTDPRLSEMLVRYPALTANEIKGISDYLAAHPDVSVDDIDPTTLGTVNTPSGTLLPGGGQTASGTGQTSSAGTTPSGQTLGEQDQAPEIKSPGTVYDPPPAKAPVQPQTPPPVHTPPVGKVPW